MFVTPAYAQDAAGGGAMGGIAGLIPFILIFVIFYFLLIRPQQRRAKEHQKMVEALKRGDRVITSGGIYGKIVKVGQEDDVEVEIADGVKIKLVKSTVAQVISKTEPAADG